MTSVDVQVADEIVNRMAAFASYSLERARVEYVRLPRSPAKKTAQDLQIGSPCPRPEVSPGGESMCGTCDVVEVADPKAALGTAIRAHRLRLVPGFAVAGHRAATPSCYLSARLQGEVSPAAALFHLRRGHHCFRAGQGAPHPQGGAGGRG